MTKEQENMLKRKYDNSYNEWENTIKIILKVGCERNVHLQE